VKQWRYRGVHVRAIEALRRNAYGRVLRIDNHTLCPRALSLLTVQSKPFYTDPAGGGLLMGWAVHNLDWVRHLAGSAPVTDSNARIFPGEAPIVDGEFEATIRFANGPAARVHVAIDVPEDPGRDHLFRTVVECERAELDLDGFGNFTVRTDAGETIEWTQPVFNPRDPSDRVRLQAYTAMLQDFVDAVRFDRAPPVSGEDGRAAVGLFRTARATS
jgi:predicted dehydrogenase